jgi:hypothetical protein
MSPHRLRLPVSTRHAFALAFDLAVRRDAVQSLIVPLLLQAPWSLAQGMLPPLKDAENPWRVSAVWIAAQIGSFVMLLVVGAMLRFRARSVFNTPPEVHPAPAIDCYANGLKRIPWLTLTEIVRNFSLIVATFFFVVPALFLGFRLSFATEAVVLNEPHMAGAFQRSFKLTEGRFERWLEMIVASVMLVFGPAFLGAVLSLIFPQPGIKAWIAVTQLLILAILPIIQYAWTFFYLRLVEVEDLPDAIEPHPAYAAAMPPGSAVWNPPVDSGSVSASGVAGMAAEISPVAKPSGAAYGDHPETHPGA